MPAYKDNKTGKWFCKFYYTDWQGNNRQKWKLGFATKKEALAYERDFLEKQSANPDMTFQNLYELYMEDMTARLKESTILTKKHICETHILPFFGRISVGYIPDGNMVGLSKLARLVNVYARRLQVQERLTREVAEAVMRTLSTSGVMVVCTAQHLCMKMRGVEKQDAATTTMHCCGAFEKDAALRAEFLSLLKV